MKPIKTFLIVSLIAVAAFIAGGRYAVSRKAPAVAPSSPPAPLPVQAPAPVARAAAVPERPTAPEAKDVKPDEAAMALASAVDLLASPQSSWAQKQAIREQLRKSGRLGEALAALRQLATQNPKDPTVAIALGEVELSQIRNILESGGDPNDVSILGLQADQSFNAALSADPTNWEAQFEKAAAMTYWPAGLGKGPETIQRLSALVTQQETMASQPEFALTYALLGKQYQAAGQADKAMQVWQQGLAQFPLNPALQQALTPHSP